MSWNIYFNNTTEKPVSFSFYQENSILDQNSYAYVWHNGISEKGEKVGPIVIPSEVFVSVQTEGEQGIIAHLFAIIKSGVIYLPI